MGAGGVQDYSLCSDTWSYGPQGHQVSNRDLGHLRNRSNGRKRQEMLVDTPGGSFGGGWRGSSSMSWRAMLCHEEGLFGA